MKTTNFLTIGLILSMIATWVTSRPNSTSKQPDSHTNTELPVGMIRQNSFDRSSGHYLFTDYERNGKVDYEFRKNWLENESFEIEFCDPKNMTLEQKKEMEQNGYDDFCDYLTGTSYYFLDHFDSENLFFFTIAKKYYPFPEYWNTGFYHFIYDKNKKKIIHVDFLTSIGGTEAGTSWKSDVELEVSTDESVFWITETNKEVLAEINGDYSYDNIVVKRKKLVFSKKPTVEEMCDSISYNIKSCGTLSISFTEP